MTNITDTRGRRLVALDETEIQAVAELHARRLNAARLELNTTCGDPEEPGFEGEAARHDQAQRAADTAWQRMVELVGFEAASDAEWRAREREAAAYDREQRFTETERRLKRLVRPVA